MAKSKVKFGLEDFTQGGLLSDVDVEFTNCRFDWTDTTYAPDPLPAFFSDLVQDDGTVTSQFWTCGGKGTDLQPSEDGKYLITESNTTVKKESNFYRLLEAFAKLGSNVNAGLEDASFFNGIKAHIERVPILKNGKPVVNQNNGRPLEILVPTELLGKKKAASVGQKAGKAVAENNGAAASASDSEAVHKAAVETLGKIIDGLKENGTMTLATLKLKATQNLIAGPYKGIRDPVVKLITDKEWLEENALTYNTILEGDKIARQASE
jgi:hypothetical protein